MKKTFLFKLCVVGTLLFTVPGCLRIPLGAKRKSNAPLVTAAEYAQIKPGMSLLEVEALVGAEGHYGGGNPVSYSWYNPDNGSFVVVFMKKGKVTNKGKGGDLPQ